ncbi:hypothetical protein NLJ89_g7053 [Agrocybe chaxingu]|uniref:DUF6697 domain-containing protein n=1 Tax=Agrocybe chaxingu TaxID=84603 RepID=A0A9W8JXY5_9AGAR|nr:hypothetical protein NLJ89_g7053 [Agrocybe chaxingu]
MADPVAKCGITEEKQYNFLAITEDVFPPADEIARLKQELETLKNANPFRMAELALEIQIERLRVVEITAARDAALQRLSDSYVSIRQKNEVIERMCQEHDGKNTGGVPLSLNFGASADQVEIAQMKAHISTLETENRELRLAIQQLQEQALIAKPIDPPPSYERDPTKIQTEEEDSAGVLLHSEDGTEVKYVPPRTEDPTVLANARNAVLADIPLPDNPPDDTLNAIVIPPPFTLHEFLSGAPGPLRTLLSNYRILHNATTCWCPDREEHGYMYSPVFKCSTNPRISTAHRWSPVDVVGRMNKPTECFYNREGLWYYAGSYRAFKMDELSPIEWAQLSTETTSAIVKETIAGRKNTSPQNIYETTQLYVAGGLKVACVALQCVGFNHEVYRSLLEYSIRFGESKWKSLATASANVLAAAASVSSVTGSLSGANSPASGAGTPHSQPSGTPTPPARIQMQTPAPLRHIPRTPTHPTHLSSAASGSPSATLGHSQGYTVNSIHPVRMVGTPPALGLGLGSSAWNVHSAAAMMMTPPASIDGKATLRGQQEKHLPDGGENMVDKGKN